MKGHHTRTRRALTLDFLYRDGHLHEGERDFRHHQILKDTMTDIKTGSRKGTLTRKRQPRQRTILQRDRCPTQNNATN